MSAAASAVSVVEASSLPASPPVSAWAESLAAVSFPVAPESAASAPLELAASAASPSLASPSVLIVASLPPLLVAVSVSSTGVASGGVPQPLAMVSATASTSRLNVERLGMECMAVLCGCARGAGRDPDGVVIKILRTSRVGVQPVGDGLRQLA